MDPTGRYMRRFDIASMTALAFTAFITPFESRSSRLWASEEPRLLFWVLRVVDSIFLADMIQTFLPYQDDQEIESRVRDRRKIASGY